MTDKYAGIQIDRLTEIYTSEHIKRHKQKHLKDRHTQIRQTHTDKKEINKTRIEMNF